MSTPSLHYLFYSYEGDDGKEQLLLAEVAEWMRENFGKSVHIKRYDHSVSVLFEDLNQVFLTRLKFHNIMHLV